MNSLINQYESIFHRKMWLQFLIFPIIIFGNHTFINSNLTYSPVHTSTDEWIFNPTTTHYYKVITDCLGWHSCENAAVAQGAHLVTVNDADEQAWLVSTFGGAELFWIGFSDEISEGSWTWISGESSTFTNWAPGEPSNSGGAEHYALMNWSNPGLWNDGHETAISRAIIERNALPSGGWIFNPTTTHYYKVITDCLGWHSCENTAVAQGAHLVTVNDADEQAWLVSTFGGAELFWIGFSDEISEGSWTWISGESSTFTNWAPGEPSNSGDAEHYALMNWSNPGLWNDGHEAAITMGIIERDTPPFSVYLPLISRH